MQKDALTISNDLSRFAKLHRNILTKEEYKILIHSAELFETLSNKYNSNDKVPPCFRDDMQAGYLLSGFLIDYANDKTGKVQEAIKVVKATNDKLEGDLKDYNVSLPKKIIDIREVQQASENRRRG